MKKSGIREIKVRGDDFTYLSAAAASARLYEIIQDKLPERIAEIEAEGDLKQIIALTKRLNGKLAMTLSEPKRQAFKKQLAALWWYTNIGRPAVYPETQTIVDNTQLGTLIIYAHETCVLCSRPERCNSCELGKALDKTCPVDRDRKNKESWQEIYLGRDRK